MKRTSLPKIALYAACGAIIITEVFEWLPYRIPNAHTEFVVGLAIVCILVTAKKK